MPIHFEELWEKCEKFHNNPDNLTDASNLLEELILKINLYKAIASKAEIPEEDQQKVKSRMLGEILFTLTGLSLKDNVNVYDALYTALAFKLKI